MLFRSIPAYQDYTIRSQVTEGMNLAGAVKAAVAETFAQTGRWPKTLTDIGIVDQNNIETPPMGKYVSKVDFIGPGTIQITYASKTTAAGFQANELIDAKTLSLQAYVSKNQDVVWRCGRANPPVGDGSTKNIDAAGTASADSVANTNITAKYTPTACRQIN